MVLSARIGLNKAFTIVIIFTVTVFGAGYLWATNHWMNTENRNVYQFKSDLLKEQLEIKPGDLNVMLDLAMAQYLEGNAKSALMTYQSILEQDPDNINALLYMGLIKADMKDYQRAVMLLEKVVKADPRLQPRLLYSNLGIAYFNTGNYPKAVKNLQLASQAGPGSGQVHYYLGMSYLKLGQFEKARIPLEKAAQIGGNTEEAKKALITVNAAINKKKLLKK